MTMKAAEVLVRHREIVLDGRVPGSGMKRVPAEVVAEVEAVEAATAAVLPGLVSSAGESQPADYDSQMWEILKFGLLHGELMRAGAAPEWLGEQSLGWRLLLHHCQTLMLARIRKGKRLKWGNEDGRRIPVRCLSIKKIEVFIGKSREALELRMKEPSGPEFWESAYSEFSREEGVGTWARMIEARAKAEREAESWLGNETAREAPLEDPAADRAAVLALVSRWQALKVEGGSELAAKWLGSLECPLPVVVSHLNSASRKR